MLAAPTTAVETSSLSHRETEAEEDKKVAYCLLVFLSDPQADLHESEAVEEKQTNV